jgi:hypothetical protein
MLASEVRSVENFNRVDVSGSIQTEIELGMEPSATVIADDNLLELIETQVSGDRLRVRMTGSCSTHNPIVVRITTPELTTYHGSGATQASLVGMAGESLEVDLSGASSFKSSVGTVSKLSVELSGASTFQGIDLIADSIRVKASGASSATVCPIDQLKAHASGASTIRYAGAPAKLSVDSSGAGSVVEVPLPESSDAEAEVPSKSSESSSFKIDL